VYFTLSVATENVVDGTHVGELSDAVVDLRLAEGRTETAQLDAHGQRRAVCTLDVPLPFTSPEQPLRSDGSSVRNAAAAPFASRR
jgi:hypothetical protein